MGGRRVVHEGSRRVLLGGNLDRCRCGRQRSDRAPCDEPEQWRNLHLPSFVYWAYWPQQLGAWILGLRKCESGVVRNLLPRWHQYCPWELAHECECRRHALAKGNLRRVQLPGTEIDWQWLLDWPDLPRPGLLREGHRGWMHSLDDFGDDSSGVSDRAWRADSGEKRSRSVIFGVDVEPEPPFGAKK